MLYTESYFSPHATWSMFSLGLLILIKKKKQKKKKAVVCAYYSVGFGLDLLMSEG